jgi:hypothetical protein
MIDNNSIACFEEPATRAGFNNLAAWLVPRDNSLITLRPFAEMLVINTANVRTADCGSLHADQDLTVIRAWNRDRPKFHRAISGQICCLHCLSHNLISLDSKPQLISDPDKSRPE